LKQTHCEARRSRVAAHGFEFDCNATNIDLLGKQAGFNHFAENVADPGKARDFYGSILGGDYPPFQDTGAKQIMQNGWFQQATTNKNLRIEVGYFVHPPDPA